MDYYFCNHCEHGSSEANGQQDDHAINVLKFEYHLVVLLVVGLLHVSVGAAFGCVRNIFLEFCFYQP